MKGLRHHRKLFIFILILLFISTSFAWSYCRSNYSLTNTSYMIDTDKIREPIRILLLTDLHNSTFGEKNQKLMELSAAQSPDLIFLTGDLLNSEDPRTEIATKLIANLCDIAPVYISLGNHEIEHHENFGTDIISLYEAAGGIVLEKQYEDITMNGQQIRVGGIYGYCLPEKYLKTKEADPEECAFLNDFQNTERYTMLLCHMPVCWMINEGLDEWNVDSIFSGHVHGGQVILPRIGGVYAPDLGYFPGKLDGLFEPEDGSSTMVLSRGLGSTESIPRLNNIPEVVTVDLVPDSSHLSGNS